MRVRRESERKKKWDESRGIRTKERVGESEA